ncbi:MAG TPA: formate dehydrogenase accessory sulfurtransferase FdhD [Verrucomicrobiales bacterium]|nr:formate dehydrogenase accessory sulfurtransferase FdhD [Verrucomicrobiales bacterium]
MRVTRIGQPDVEETDRVALEEPLQLVVDGHPVAVLMRTPGNDEELAAGFLWTEGIISSQEEIVRIDLEAKENHALVFLADGVEVDFGRLTRHLFSASSCGLCGKATIEAITSLHEPVAMGPVFSESVLMKAPTMMRAAQATFEETGGLHASAVFDRQGQLLTLREDVGRHNALDKALGWALMNSVDLSNSFVLMSGRLSFELMQKALAGRIPVVAGISAPSSLAVEFARESNQTLVGFLRPPRFNIYAGSERVGEQQKGCE